MCDPVNFNMCHTEERFIGVSRLGANVPFTYLLYSTGMWNVYRRVSLFLGLLAVAAMLREWPRLQFCAGVEVVPVHRTGHL